MVRTIAGALAMLACVGSAASQQPGANDSEREARLAAGNVLLTVLKDPGRCGAEAPPRGYACAVMLYRDTTADAHPNKAREKLPEVLTVRVTSVMGLEGPPGEVNVQVLSPFDDCPREFSPFGMQTMRMSSFSMTRAEAQTMELKSVLGWAENEALPPGSPRHADPKVFKLPRCRPRY
jgi:hypothetical protein